jgi:hypothetical protein
LSREKKNSIDEHPRKMRRALLGAKWHLLKPIPVVSGENLGGIDPAVEATGTYSRRFVEDNDRNHQAKL